MDEKLDVVLMYCFESPKKDWTLVTFGAKVDGQLEVGYKPLEMWYPHKGIKSELTPEMFGQTVTATMVYQNNNSDITRVTRLVKSFEFNGRTYNLL